MWRLARDCQAYGMKNPSIKSKGFLSYEIVYGLFGLIWWAVGDLNPRLPPCEDGTLPLS